MKKNPNEWSPDDINWINDYNKRYADSSLRGALDLLDTLEFNYAEYGKLSGIDISNLRLLIELNLSDPKFFSENDKIRI